MPVCQSQAIDSWLVHLLFTLYVAWIFSAGAGLGEVNGWRTFQGLVLQEQTRAPAIVLFSLSAGRALYVYGDSLSRSRLTRIV